MKTVDSNSPVPVRSQLRAILMEEIRTGVFAPNQRISSERDLAERYGASRASIREAIMELISSGVLFRAGGRGTFVSEDRPPAPVAEDHSRRIGFWISAEIFHFVQVGYTRILSGVQELCREHHCALDFHAVDEDLESLSSLFQENPQQTAASGHIIAGGLRSSTFERLRNLEKPLLVVDPLTRQKMDGIDRVRIDYAGGTREAVRHLADLGHREIGFIGFPNSEKYETYWTALEEQQLRYVPRFVQFLQMPDLAPSMMAGFQSMNALLASPERPTAVLVANDFIALGVLEALSIAGLSVPEDMSVVGFDDIGQGKIPLTTVSCDLVNTGRTAASKLLERLQNPDKPAEEITMPVKLITRRSTGPAVDAAAAMRTPAISRS
jgi:DNA-binding LacI/PurR family transcriptional regulator